MHFSRLAVTITLNCLLVFATHLGAEIEHATLIVKQLGTGNSPAEVDVSFSSSSAPGVSTLDGLNNRGDYYIMIWDSPNPVQDGVLITSVAQNARDNGDGPGYPVTTGFPNNDGDQYYVGVYAQTGPFNGEFNVNASMAWFPFADPRFPAGRASNSVGGEPMDALTASAGIDLDQEFVDNGDGTYSLDLTGLGNSSQDGILLVNGAKNDNTYALSQANADGTFTIYAHDRLVNGANYGPDPATATVGISFAYLPFNHASPQIAALGRVDGQGDGTTSENARVTKASSTGTWHLTIDGHSPDTGTLLISPECGEFFNVDNIISYQWDAGARHWVIQSRDLVGNGLQDLETEQAFSFAFFTSPPLHVDASAPAGGDGLSWATTFQKLEDALEIAHDGDEVWVAQGTYKRIAPILKTFVIRNGVKVFGGFPSGGGDGSFTARDPNPATNGTVLSGDINGDDTGTDFSNYFDNAEHVVSMLEVDGSTRIDGFTIRGGFARTRPYGGGLFADHGSPTLVNLIVEWNTAQSGGGLAFRFPDSDPVSAPRLINVIARNNHATNDGGGLYADRVGAFSLTNVIFSDNQANRGGGIFAFLSQATIFNGTIANNHADLRGGGGSGSNVTLYNTIVWGNTAPDYPGLSEFALSPNSRNNIDQDAPGVLDPQFSSPDYHLASTSPAIDAGDAALLDIDDFDLDLDGNTVEVTPVDVSGHWRLNGLAVDIGARESNPPLTRLDRTVLTESWEVGIDEGGITDFLPNGWEPASAPTDEVIWRPGGSSIGSRFDEAEPLTFPAHGNNTLYLREGFGVFKVTDIVIEAGKVYTLSAAIGEDRALDSTAWHMELLADTDGSGQLDNAFSLAAEHWNSETAVLPEEGQWKHNTVRFSGANARPEDLGQRLIIHLYNNSGQKTAYADNLRLEVTGDADILTTSPVVGAIDVPAGDPITVRFASPLNPSTIDAETVLVRGSISGDIDGNLSLDGDTLTFTPSSPFAEGETIAFKLDDRARTTSGATVDSPPLSFQTTLPSALRPLVTDNLSRAESLAGNGVNTWSGAFNAQFSPITISGVRTLGFPLSYNSLFTSLTGSLGYGWSHAYEIRLTGDPHGVMTVLWDSTRRNRFAFAGPGKPYTPLEQASHYDELIRRSDGYWWLTLQDGTVYEFGPTGRLERVANKVFQWLDLHYADGLLQRVHEPISDKTLTLHYDADDRLAGLSDDLGRESYFLYDDRSRLVAVTDPLLFGAGVISGDASLKNIPDNSTNGLLHEMTFQDDGTVGRLRVELGTFIHQRISDLKITLTSPSGHSAVIHDREDHSNEFAGLLIDDFDGEPVRGTWQLLVQDLVAGVSGQLSKWEMRFTGSTNAAHYSYASGDFPGAGRLVFAEDVLGHRLFSNTYDSIGRVLTQDDGLDSNALGQFAYLPAGSSGQLTQYTDRTGELYEYEHDQHGHLIRAADPLGSEIRMAYNARGDRTEYVNALGFKTRFEYDSTGNLIKAIEHDGREIPFLYDERRNVTEIQNLVTSEFSYDSLNNATRLVQPSGSVSENDYDASSQLSQLVDFRFEQSTNTLEEDIRIGWSGTMGKRRIITLPQGGEIVYDYDALGQVVSTTNAGGHTTTRRYTQTGKLASETDPLGNTSRKCYDHRDRLVIEIDNKGNRKEFHYDGNDNLIARVNALNEQTSLRYDGEDRPIGAVDPAGREKKFIRDAAGQIIESIDPLGRSTYFLYDLAGQEIKRYADDRTLLLETTYDAFGDVISEKDGDGKVTRFDYTELRQAKDIEIAGKPYSRTTEFSPGRQPLEGLGGSRRLSGDRLQVLTNPRGAETEFRYDSAGRVAGVYTLGRLGTDEILRIEYTYDNRDLITHERSTSGREIDYRYDELGRLVEVTPNTGHGKAFSFDKNGNTLTSSKKNGENVSETITREYDALDRLIRYTDANQQTLLFQYNSHGAVSLIVYPDDKTVHYTYDAAGRLTAVRDWDNRITSYHYNRRGKVELIEFPNGTRRKMNYNNSGQVVHRADISAGGQLIVGYDYSRDHPLEIAQEHPLHQEPAYLPENLTMSYDQADRLMTVNDEPVTFDFDGNMTEAPLGLGTLTYDAYNNLTSAGDYSYQVDAEDHLAGWKTGNQQTTFTINPANGFSQILVKKNPDGTTTNYVYGIGLLYQDTNGISRTFHYDHRGSTAALSDDSGNIAGRIAYGPFGEIVSRQNDTDTIFLYNGMFGVATSPQGLVYMRFRWYWPDIKRFITRDAHIGDIFVAGSMNRYAYAGNNPVSRIDPTGELWWVAAGAAAGAVIGVAAEFTVDVVDGGGLTSTWEDYSSAAIGGAVTGAILTVAPGAAWQAGSAGAFADSLSGTLLHGDQVNLGVLARDTIIGGALGKLGKVAGGSAGKKLGNKVSKRIFGKSITAARRSGRRGIRQIAGADRSVKLLTSRARGLSTAFEEGTGFMLDVFGEATSGALLANLDGNRNTGEGSRRLAYGKQGIVRQALFDPQASIEQQLGTRLLWQSYIEALQLAGRPVPSHPNNTIDNF